MRVTMTLLASAMIGVTGAMPAHAAVTFDEATVSASPYVYVQSGSEVDGNAIVGGVSTFTFPVVPLTQAGTVSASVTGASAVSTESATMTLSSPASGHFTGAADRSVNVTTGDYAAAGDRSNLEPYFRYIFTIDAPTIFSYDFLSSGTSGTSAVFALQGGSLAGGAPTLSNGDKGTIAIDKSGQYALYFSSRVPFLQQSGTGTASASYRSDFSFTLTPLAAGVPEPASWALMIAGFGLTGGMMRRRKQTGRPLAAWAAA